MACNVLAGAQLPLEGKLPYIHDGLFSLAITGCLSLDLWIEMTMKKKSKIKTRWSRMLKNELMLLVHTRTVIFSNRIRVSLHAMENYSNVSICQVEKSSSQLKVDEQAVQDMDNCMTEFL